jgi:hypothetical protein
MTKNDISFECDGKTYLIDELGYVMGNGVCTHACHTVGAMRRASSNAMVKHLEVLHARRIQDRKRING